MSSAMEDRVLLHLDEVLGSPAFVTHARCATLLRYLVEQSLADKTPHEIDIAIDVFGKDSAFNAAENSSVRVSMHQLRKMLRDHYSSRPDAPDAVRFSIPKGSYRVSFGIAPAEQSSPATPARWLPLPDHRIGVGALVALLLASLAVNALFLIEERGADLVAAAPAPEQRLRVLGNFAEGSEPILIVLGDFFVFREGGAEAGQPRFVRQVDINSDDDLRRLAGDDYGVTVAPSQRSYLPKAAAFALETLLPFANATGKSVSMKLMSDVSGEDLRDNDVIYVGYLRSLGPLRDFFFRSSNFCSESPFTELLHKSTGESFARSGYPFEQVLDYGLFAKMAGPGSGDILLFTGISDVGILHAVRTLTDPAKARNVEQAVTTSLDGIPPELEILFEVSGYDRADLVGTNVAAFKRLAALQPERALIDVKSGPNRATEPPLPSPCGSPRFEARP
jgi:hypothetical protein